MSSLELKPNPTLKDLQEYVAHMIEVRGFGEETLPEVFMLFMEECGEFAKAIRKHSGMKTDDTSEKFKLSSEAADILTLFLDLCTMLNIDLEQAFREKEEINKTRTWN